VKEGSPAISLREVSKWYGPVIGVNEVSLEIGPSITGLLGPNGAGKSTLMKLITGQLRPSIGDALVLGKRTWRSISARREIGFAPEVDAFHEEMTGRQFVRAMARLSGLSRRTAGLRAEETLQRVGMGGLAHKTLRACSKGMRQRVKLAQALVHDPKVVVLDEPLSGIDPAGRLEIMALFEDLRDQGKTVLVSTHILHEIESITDQIILMARGRVLAAGALGRIRDILAEHPLTLRITTNRRRALGAALLAEESVAGVYLGEGAGERSAPSGRPADEDGPPSDGAGLDGAGLDGGDLIIKTRRPEDFFRALPSKVVGLGVNVERLEALDASAEAVFGYLVTGGSPGVGAP
jgi:ABC-2 type transport system ATP-binding protein